MWNGNIRIEISPTVIGKQDPIQADICAHFRILPALDSFADDLAVPMLTQPDEFVPGKVRGDVAAHQSANATTAGIIASLHAGHGGAQTLIHLHPLVGFSLSRSRGVHCHHDGIDSKRADVSQEFLGLSPISVHVQLEEECVRIGRDGRDDLFRGETGICADSLGHSFFNTAPCNRLLAVGMNHLDHGGRRHKEGNIHFMAKDSRRSRHTTDITQQSRSKPDAAEEILIAVSRETRRVCGGIEAPRFLADGSLRDILEILGVDDGGEERFFIPLRCGGDVKSGWGTMPVGGDGGGVDASPEFVGVEGGGEDGWSVDCVVRGGCVSTGVFPDDYCFEEMLVLEEMS